MIEKMNFFNITGPKDSIDYIIDTYLTKYDIQLEPALTELKTVQGLLPLTGDDPYKESLSTISSIYEELNDKGGKAANITIQRAADIANEINKKLSGLKATRQELQSKKDTCSTKLSEVKQFIDLDYNIETILHFNYIKIRFGRFTKDYYKKFISQVYETTDSIFLKCSEDSDYISGVYFTPPASSEKNDAVYASMHFERFWVPDEYKGTPKETCELLSAELEKLDNALADADKNIQELLNANKEDILSAYSVLKRHNNNSDIKKLAACTKHDGKNYFILCGWASKRDALKLQEELKAEPQAICIVEENHNNLSSTPPIKLKNNPLFKPFEMFVGMYGLPNYKEIDPTVLIGITYSIFFGFMFGDVGQGLVLLIGGLLLAKLKGSQLAGIIARCGFFSTIFGFLFGSFFGFEDVLPALWLRPSEAKTTLPFIGTLNTVFIVAVAIGMGIILCMMLLNIINRIRLGECGEALFDTNGIAGLVFYGMAVLTIMLFMSGHTLPAGILLGIFFIVPLLLIFFKEPLSKVLEHKKETEETGIGMFIVQGFFELFEVLLSYFSNTLSFVRVGAFAVSHAAMMSVVLMLAGAEGTGSINWAVVVLGNLFVCGMEGLIVGIQVLRLEYYELFSRFYTGDGRAFAPNNHIK